MIVYFNENWNCIDYNLSVTCFSSSWFSWFEQFLENSLNCHRNCNAELVNTFPCCKEEFATLILACSILGINTPLAYLMTYHLNSIPAKNSKLKVLQSIQCQYAFTSAGYVNEKLITENIEIFLGDRPKEIFVWWREHVKLICEVHMQCMWS